MERNPQVFKVDTLLYLWKRRVKDDDDDLSDDDRHFVEPPKRDMNENVKYSNMVIFDFF